MSESACPCPPGVASVSPHVTWEVTHSCHPPQLCCVRSDPPALQGPKGLPLPGAMGGRVPVPQRQSLVPAPALPWCLCLYAYQCVFHSFGGFAVVSSLLFFDLSVLISYMIRTLLWKIFLTHFLFLDNISELVQSSSIGNTR